MVIDFNGARDFDTLAHFVRTGEMKLPDLGEKKCEGQTVNQICCFFVTEFCCEV